MVFFNPWTTGSLGHLQVDKVLGGHGRNLLHGAIAHVHLRDRIGYGSIFLINTKLLKYREDVGVNSHDGAYKLISKEGEKA
jgi:hypothetical protein